MLKKKKGVGDQMGWATTHSQSCVATLQWCRDKRGAVCTTGEPMRMTKDLCARGCARRGLSRQSYLGFSVTTELAQPVSRQGFGQQGLVCSDTDFGVAIVALQCETGVYRDSFGCMVGLVPCRDSGTSVGDSSMSR